MPKIRKPLPFPELDAQPPLKPQITISEDMAQVLALLSGFDGGKRRIIKVTETGVLQTVNPQHQLFANLLADEANYTWQGGNTPITEVLVRAHPDNSQRVWVNVFAAAAVDTGWPLDGGEYIPLVITNLKHLQLLIVDNGEKVILEYTL